jgi:hypothetical protein
MISVVELYNSTSQRMKSGTSGYTTQAEWNNILSSVQKELSEYLFTFYESNTQVQDALSFLAKPATASVTTAGLSKPSDYLHFISATIGGYPVYPIKLNQRAIVSQLSSRKPSSANGKYYYYMEDNKIKFLPSETLSVNYTYLRKPTEASIVLTATEDDYNDYLTPTMGADLEWPTTMFNLILYMMLEKLGLEAKDQLTLEFSQLGIQKESIKL